MQLTFLPLLLLVTKAVALSNIKAQQVFANLPIESSSTQPSTPSDVRLSGRWIALGPFPAGMREIPFGGNPALAFGNPAFLLDEQRNLSIPSAYSPHADGLVPLQLFHSQDTFNDTLADVPRSSARSSVQHVVSHQLSLSYPEVQWEYIRASAGWASSQWQGLVVSDLVIEPDGNASTRATYAFVLDRTAQFAVIPQESWDRASTEANGHLDAEWHNGDWYSYNGAAYQLSSNSEHGASSHETPQTNPQRFLLPHLLRLQPGRYKLLLRVMYETRAFGEPRLQSPEGIPIITVKIDIGRVHTLSNTPSVEILAEGPVAVVPSVVGGWIAGWGFSIPLRNSGEGTVVVRDVRVKGMPGLIVKPSMQLEEARIGSLQTRPIALRVEQSSALAPDVEELDISFSIVSTEPHAHPTRIDATIKLDHRPAFQDASECPPSELCDYLITYLSPFGTVDFAAVIPPKLPSDVTNGKAEPPMILGLHGAGVDAADRVWPQAFNRQNHSWIILPSGGTGWGYDWQLRSHDTASAALIAQAKNVYGAPPGSKDGWKGDAARVLVVGHSNGGQGAAYFMSRDPDRVIGGVVAAGYIKVSDYVPFTWHEGRHYLDHRLAGILHSSLTMFENDLHASNLAGIPLLWKYGSRDEDVPPHHSPTMSGLVEQWNARLGFQMGTSRVSRVSGKSHWYPSILREEDVQTHIDAVLGRSASTFVRKDDEAHADRPSPKEAIRTSFVVANPHESGSKNGWTITRLREPGELARLDVVTQVLDDEQGKQYYVHRLSNTNVECGTFDPTVAQLRRNATHMFETVQGTEMAFAARSDAGIYRIGISAGYCSSRQLGPMITFLKSDGPIQVILPTQNISEARFRKFHSMALRFAADSFVYGRIDTVIVQDQEVESTSPRLTCANVLLLGNSQENLISRRVRLSDSVDQGNLAWDRRTGVVLSMKPHPDQQTCQKSASLILLADLDEDLELAQHLLPVRTGTTIPEMIAVGRDATWKGTGGVLAAGWFANDWKWSERMSFPRTEAMGELR